MNYKRYIPYIRLGLFVLVVLSAIHIVSSLGWPAVVASLPKTLWFYVVLMSLFLVVPFANYVIYWKYWQFSELSWQELLGVMLKKQAKNDLLVSYAGEGYLLLWAESRIPRDTKAIVGLIKDNAIISALCAYGLLAVFVALYFLQDGDGDSLIDSSFQIYGKIFVLVVVLFCALIVTFGKRLFFAERVDIIWIALIHMVKFFTINLLVLIQYSLVFPDVNFSYLFGLVLLRMCLGRIPFVPNKDLTVLVFVSQIVSHTELSVDSLAAVSLVNAVCFQLLSAMIVLLYSISSLHCVFRHHMAKKDSRPLVVK